MTTLKMNYPWYTAFLTLPLCFASAEEKDAKMDFKEYHLDCKTFEGDTVADLVMELPEDGITEKEFNHLIAKGKLIKILQGTLENLSSHTSADWATIVGKRLDYFRFKDRPDERRVNVVFWQKQEAGSPDGEGVAIKLNLDQLFNVTSVFNADGAENKIVRVLPSYMSLAEMVSWQGTDNFDLRNVGCEVVLNNGRDLTPDTD